MRIAMGGATGFVGKHLRRRFEAEGWAVIPLSRSDLALPAEALAEKLIGADVIINIAGAPVDRRWSRRYKALLVSSRVGTTERLVEAIGLLEVKPSLYIGGSAVGIYPSKKWHDELSEEYAYTFLGELCQQWEAAATEVKAYGVRTVIFRLGIVLGNGGMLSRMLPAFRLGLGGVVGNGRQYLSWIHIGDLCEAFARAVSDAEMRGIYNLVAPRVSTNKELTEALGTRLHRPTFMRLPYWFLRLVFGEGAQVIAGGQWAVPRRLLDAGFSFRFEHLGDALDNLLAKRHD